MKIKIIIIILLSFFINGCYNYKELENLSICTAMAIDKEENKYEVSYMVANSRKNEASSKEGESQATVYTGNGKTISEAVDNLITKIPKVPYIAHLETIIISDKVAYDGVQNILDYLLRHPESSKKYTIYLTKDTKASDALKLLSPLESLPSSNILSIQKTSTKYQSLSLQVEFNEFVATILEEGINPVISGIEIIGDVEEGGKSESLNQTTISSFLKSSTIGIFKNDKLLKFANYNETIGINFLKNNVHELIIPVPCDDNYIVLNIENSKTNIIVEDDVTIDVKVESVLNEVNCKKDINNNDVLTDISKQAEKIIKGYIEEAINLAKNEKTDIFGFGKNIHKNNYKKWSSIKNNWDELGFNDLKINTNVTMQIKSTGSMKHSMEELK